MVSGGHTTKTPSLVTYSSVVSRDLVIIMLMLEALNSLDLQAADIKIYYITAPCCGNIWAIAGPEFGIDKGKVYILVRDLYGLKISGAAFMLLLSKILDEIGIRSSVTDPDVWYREATKSDCEEYYE